MCVCVCFKTVSCVRGTRLNAALFCIRVGTGLDEADGAGAGGAGECRARAELSALEVHLTLQADQLSRWHVLRTARDHLFRLSRVFPFHAAGPSPPPSRKPASRPVRATTLDAILFIK